MAKLHYTKERQMISANSTTLFPNVNALFGPWESFEEFNTWFTSNTDVDIPNGTEAGIIQADNSVKKYVYNKPLNGTALWISVEDLLNAKQDIIRDLETIRNGAALGATALQSHQSLDNYYNKTESDARYIREHQSLANYQQKLVSGNNIKTVNGNSILGSGNISISGTGDGEANVIESIKVNEIALEVDTNKAVNISVPTKTSDLNNDAGFLTEHQSLSGKQDVISDLSTIRSGAAAGATALQGVTVTAGKYTSVTTTSNNASFKVPTKFSHLDNDTNFVVESTEFSSEDGAVYRIVDDLDFDGAEIELGADSQIIFEGGSISNVTITGSNTSITAAPVQIFGSDVVFGGTWNVRECYPEWWGAKGDGTTDDLTAFDEANNSPFCEIKLLAKTYIISNGIWLRQGKSIEGISVSSRTQVPALKVSSSVNTSSPIDYMLRLSSNCNIRNFLLWGDGRSYYGIYGVSSNGSADSDPHRLNIEGIAMYNFKIGLSLHTFLTRISGCSVTGARVGFQLLGGTSTTMINCYVKGFMMMAYFIKSMTYSTMINCCADTCHAWSDGTRSGSTNPTQTESADTVTDAEKQSILGNYYSMFYGFTYLLNQCRTITMVSCACEDVVKGIFLENSHVVRIIGTTMDMQGVTRTSDAGRVLFSQISNHVTIEGMYVTDWAGNGWETQSDKILAFYSGSSKYNVVVRNFQMRSYNSSHVDTTWFLKDSNIRETGSGENTITITYDRWKKRGVESAKPDNLGWIVGRGFIYYNTTKKIAEMWTGTRWVELICNDDSSFYTFTTENISKAYDELETYDTGWTSGSSLVQDVSDQEWKLINGLFYNAGIEGVWDGSFSNDIGEELPATIYVPDEGTAMSSVWFRVYEGDIISVITTRKGNVPQASPTLLITDSDHCITYRKLSSNIITGYDDNDEPIYDMETLIEDRVTNYEVLRDGYGFVSTAEGGEDTFYLGIRRTTKTDNINARLTALESSMPVSISLANFQIMMDNETYTEGTIYNVT